MDVEKEEANASEKTESEKKERFKELEKLIGVQESRIQSLQSSAFQLANYYFVFQGVVLATIYNPTSHTSTDPMYIFALSLIAALLNLCALYSIASKYVRVMDQHDQTWSEFNKAASAMVSMNPPAASAMVSKNPPAASVEFTGDYRSDNFSKTKRKAVLLVCMILLITSTVFTLVCPWRVGKHQLPHAHSDSGCLKLCDQSSRCMLFCQDMTTYTFNSTLHS